MLQSLCGVQVCPYLCVRAQHCQVGLVRRSQRLASLRVRRHFRRTQYLTTLNHLLAQKKGGKS